MNKNIKKVAAIAITLSALCSIAPATNLNMFTTKAYAASGDLTSIKLKSSDGTTIKTYSEDDYKSKNEVDYDDMDDKETYYAKASSTSIKINTAGVSSNRVRIFKGKSSSTKGVKTSSAIELTTDSTTTLTIRTYSEDPGTVKYNDDSYDSEYIIKVKYVASSSNESEDEDGDVYLKSLSLSDGTINFSKSTSIYNVNVAESVSDVKITAKPDCDSDEYDNYEVTINGTIVDEDDKFRKTVSLNKGKNEIKISVEDDNDEKRAYTLNITRGQINTDTGNNGTTPKTDKWIVVNGKWQYLDSKGQLIKNTWFYDKNYGKSYFLQADGNMATGWLSNNSKWYYLGEDGAMKTGWQLVSGSWYYLNSQGVMAYNTVIDGYKLSSNGAWIK